MIQCEHLSKTYRAAQGEVQCLKGVNLAVSPGEFLIVRGPSGSGKTTLLLLMGGLLRPSSGIVRFAGRDLYALSAAHRARVRAQEIGFVFQLFHLMPYLTVLENVCLAARPQAAGGDMRGRGADWLRRLGLAERMHHKPSALSAGEQQRCAIARALVSGPKVVLADEPTGNLDPENAAEVFQHLARFHREGGTVVVVTHGTAGNRYASRVIELRAGQLVNCGETPRS